MPPRRAATKRAAVDSEDDSGGADDSEYEQDPSVVSAHDDDDDDDIISVSNGASDEEDDDDFATKPKKPATSTAKSKTKGTADVAKPKAKASAAPPSKKVKIEKAAATTNADGTLRKVAPDDPACAPHTSAADTASAATVAPSTALPMAPMPAASAGSVATVAETSSAPPPKSATVRPAAAPAAKPPAVASSKAAPVKPTASSSTAPSTAPPASTGPPLTGDGILDHLRATSRPTTAQLIAEHFRGGISKGEAERRCADLVASGKACGREAGKIKLYWASQQGIAALSKEEEVALDRDLAEVQARRAQWAAEVANQHKAIKALKSARSLDEVRDEVMDARAALEQVKEQCAAVRKEHSGGEPMSAADEAQVKKDYMKYRKAYLSRRATCYEILGYMGEAQGKSNKKLLEELGLETDEDYGVNRGDFPALY